MIKLQAVWAVLSSVWEKALPFVIKHWKLILIVALSVALFLKMRADYKAMETAYEARLESSEAQLEGLKENVIVGRLVPAGTGNIKNRWNKKALEDDNKFLSEQEKIEPSETQTNQ